MNSFSDELTTAGARTWGNISVAEATQQLSKQKQLQKSQWMTENETFWKEHNIKESDREIIQVCTLLWSTINRLVFCLRDYCAAS